MTIPQKRVCDSRRYGEDKERFARNIWRESGRFNARRKMYIEILRYFMDDFGAKIMDKTDIFIPS